MEKSKEFIDEMMRVQGGLLRVYRMDNRMTVLKETPVWAFLKNDNYHYVLSHIKE